MRNKSHLFLVLFLALMSGYFRYISSYDWLIFGMDQEYQALISDNIIHFRHFPFIGVNASDTGIYLGPWFSYLAAVLFFLSSGDPFGGAVFASSLGVLTTIMIYIVGKRIVHPIAAYTGAVVYGGSFLLSYYDRQFWNPSLVPLISLFIGYWCHQFLHHRRSALIWIFALVGISLSIHLSLLFFLPLICFLMWKQWPSLEKRIFYYACGVFLVFISPLIVFDLRHQGVNTRAIFRMFSGTQSSTVVPDVSDRISLFFSSVERIFFLFPGTDWFTLTGQCKEFPFTRETFPYGGVTIFSFLMFLLWKKKHIPFVIWYVMGMTICVVFLYRRQVFEYYYLYFFPWFALSVGVSVWSVVSHLRYGRVLLCGMGILYLSANVWSFSQSTYSYPYRDKMNVVRFALDRIGDRGYTLEAIGGCPRYGGWRYLFGYSGHVPSASYMDPFFSWLYPEKKPQNNPEVMVLLTMIDERLSDEETQSYRAEEEEFLKKGEILAEETFGRIIVRIMSLKGLQLP